MMMKMTTQNQLTSTVSFFEIINLRSQWEAIVDEFKIPDNNGTIDNLRWYVENGHSSNRFRRNFKKSIVIAKQIVDYVDENYEATNIPSVSRKKV